VVPGAVTEMPSTWVPGPVVVVAAPSVTDGEEAGVSAEAAPAPATALALCTTTGPAGPVVAGRAAAVGDAAGDVVTIGDVAGVTPVVEVTGWQGALSTRSNLWANEPGPRVTCWPRASPATKAAGTTSIWR
jgi:hypothetical protein